MDTLLATRYKIIRYFRFCAYVPFGLLPTVDRLRADKWAF